MTRRIWGGCWAGLVAAGLAGGCGSLPERTKPPHPSANLLDTGPAAKVTNEQAADVQFAVGRTNEENDQLDLAEAAYRSALGKNSRRGDIEARLAIVLDRKGTLDEADQHFARALKLAPKDPDLLCDRGYSFYLRGKTAEAEKALRAALALAPKHPRSHTNLGLVLAKKGDTGGAMAEFTRAGADPADARANLALTLALEGKTEAARDQYAEALRAKPTSAAAAGGLRVASNVLKAGQAKPGDLPRLPGEPSRPTSNAAAIASSAPRADSAVLPTSFTR